MSKKRFTDCDKWDDPWFAALKFEHKVVWQYLCDVCDAAGVWVVNVALAHFRLGKRIDLDASLAAFGDRVRVLANGAKWHLVKFVRFQYPQGLMDGCKPHRGVIALLKSHGIDPSPFLQGSSTPPLDDSPKQLRNCLATDQDKDKEQEKDKDSSLGGSKGGQVDRDAIIDQSRPLGTPIAKPRVPVLDIDRLRHAEAIIGRDSAGSWQLIVDDHGLPAVEAAVRAAVARGEKPLHWTIRAQLGSKGPKRAAFAIDGDGNQVPWASDA